MLPVLLFLCWWAFQVSSFAVVEYSSAGRRAGSASPTTILSATASSLSVRLPLHDDFVGHDELEPLLQKVADSTDFIQDVTALSDKKFSCQIPALNCAVYLEECGEEKSLLLGINGGGNEKQLQGDFGWICVKFYEQRGLLEEAGIDCSALRESVVGHMNRLPADPGLDAATDAWTLVQKADFHNLAGGDMKKLLRQLDREGYVVIDPIVSGNNMGPLETNACQQEMLSDYLFETTDQGDEIRTDRVHFLSREQAEECTIDEQYDLLLGIANHFNNHRKTLQEQDDEAIFQEQPISPATESRPYTNPRRVQFAEYGEGDFYKDHSDNSLASTSNDEEPSRSNNGDQNNLTRRNNFRAYTCILYLNDNDWDVKLDGGALRLYPHTQAYHSPELAVADSSNAEKTKDGMNGDGSSPFVDISPINGRLLIFDSHLVHSVREVLSSTKVRRALTLWINKPNDSGVMGETFY